MFQCPNSNNRIHLFNSSLSSVYEGNDLDCHSVSVHRQCLCQCLSVASFSQKTDQKNAAQKPKRFHKSGVEAARRFCTLTNFTRVLPCPPLSLNYWLCNHKCTKDDGYAWPAAKCSRKNPHLFFFFRPVDLFCLKPLRVRNDIETLLSPQHREIDGNVTSLLKSRDT